MHENVRQILAELKGSWRFRWIAVAAAWVVCVFGWLAVLALPNNFDSEATVYVDTNGTRYHCNAGPSITGKSG